MPRHRKKPCLFVGIGLGLYRAMASYSTEYGLGAGDGIGPSKYSIVYITYTTQL